MKLSISQEEINSKDWTVAREMCERHGWDINEIAQGIARFRMLRAEARAQAMAELAAKVPVMSTAAATLVHFNQVKQFWNARHQVWTRRDIVYIGRAMTHLNLNLPNSPFANLFRIDKDSDDAREDAIELYANWIQLPAQADLLHRLDGLRGKILVCWCHPRRCHGDVLLKLLQDRTSISESEDQSILETATEWQPDTEPILEGDSYANDKADSC